ncbi:MAG: hypothetical protein OQK57_07990 [Ignavibacteriaceae bacterium]|nr:hypothetical protein [Ignavibacteriaceae bacterium]
MDENSKQGNVNKSITRFTSPVWLKSLLIILSVSALIAGFIMGLQVFEALAEFKRLGIFIIIGSVIGAVLLLAIVKILNDLAYIKNKLAGKGE